MPFTPQQIWYDRQRILELILVVGKVRDHREIYKLLVEAKKIKCSPKFRYDLREYVRFSITEGFVHDDVEALLSLGYLKESASLKLTELGKKYLEEAGPSEDFEIFKQLKTKEY